MRTSFGFSLFCSIFAQKLIKVMLKKIISGGQTGIDKIGLIAAAENGFDTGGTAPSGFITENGVDYT